MYAREVRASLVRRWYLVITAAVVTLVASALTFTTLTHTYEMQGSTVLIPPKDKEAPGANRYLSLSGLDLAASVTLRALNSDRTVAAVEEQVPGGEFVVEPDYTTSAPILVVTATNESKLSTAELLQAVMAQIPVVVRRLQKNLDIERSSRITTLEITRAREVTSISRTRLRAALAVGGALGFLLMLGIAALDGMLLRRSRGSAQGPQAPSPSSTTAVGSESQRSEASGAASAPPRRKTPPSPPAGATPKRKQTTAQLPAKEG